MTNDQILIAGGLIALVIIVFLLKDKIFSIIANKKGVTIDSQQPQQRPGVEVKDVVSRKRAVMIENNAGDGVKAQGINAAEDVTVTNNPPPKP